MIDSKNLSEALAERFGLEVNAITEKVPKGQKVIIRPENIEHTISFQVEMMLGWRTITATFVPGSFARELIQKMNSASPDQKLAFAVFANSLESKGAVISLQLDGKNVKPDTLEDWPLQWHNITISMKKIGVVLEQNNNYNFDAAFPWTTGFFGMALALLPLEPVEESNNEGKPEGAVQQKLIKQYERSRINRAACMEIHGTSCKICGFNFGKIYGDLGKGFIHVHHIVPVSQMGGSYVLNPATDLIPVCPNCHAMLHRKTPPLLPKELIIERH